MPDASVIHDIGYRRYEGPRGGRGYAARSLYSQSLRTAFGIGRGFKAKLFPWSIVGLVTFVAVLITAISSQSGERVSTYPEFTDVMGLIAMLFLAVVAPELVSRDLRAGLLTLYFARPLRRSDYALAKLGAIVTATWLLLGGPQLIIFMGLAFDADGPGEVWREFTDFAGGVLYSGIYAVVAASIALLIASLSGKRAFAAGGVVAVFLVTMPVAGVLMHIGGDGAMGKLAGVFTPSWLIMGVGRWLIGHDQDTFDIGGFGPVYGATAAAFVAACTVLLIVRYRKVAS
jgi:ABC-2 type transport system permease protein